MKDVALIHQQIVKRLSQFENGVVSETMNNMGLKYPTNYGLAIPQIDKIAASLNKDNELAAYLWQQKERESKLLALRILNFNNIQSEQLDAIIKGIVNVELAEQAAIQLFANLKNAFAIALMLIRNINDFAKLSGFVLISRIARENKNRLDTEFTAILDGLLNHLPDNDAIYLKRGLANALLRIGLRNNYLKNKVFNLIETLVSKKAKLSNYLDQEVNYYLLTTN